MAGRLTKIGVEKIAQKQASGEPLIISNFIFAHIDGLNPEVTPPENEQIPSPQKIQYISPITRAGYVNPAQVVYSVIIDSDVGDWPYNWIGLQDNEGDLFAVVYIPTQQKVKNQPPGQIGNTITRNFLIAYDSLQAITQITIPAESWQFDITDILNHIEDNQRQAVRDIFGRALFFNTGFKVIKNTDSTFSLSLGSGYIEGLRIEALTNSTLNIDTDTKVWLDIFQNKVNGKSKNIYQIAYSDDLIDYIDEAKRRHYVINIATIENNEPIDNRQILGHASLVDSISDDPDSDPRDIASIAALNKLKEDLIVNTNDLIGNVILTKEQRGIVNIDATTADTLVTLPASDATNKGLEFILMRTDNTDNMLKVQCSTSDKVLFHLNLNPLGYSHFELFGHGDFWHVYSTGQGSWLVMGRHDATPIGTLNPLMALNMPVGGYFPAMRFSFDINRFPWLRDFAASSSMIATVDEADDQPGKWVIDTANNLILSPDTQGEFIRSLDLTKGVDTDRQAGSTQGDAIRNIKGTTAGYGAGHDGKLFSVQSPFYEGFNANGTNRRPIVFDASRVVPTANENRPRNIAYLSIFKAI